MSPQEPQEHIQKVNGAVVRRRRSLRDLPGFTTAAVAFVVVLLLGGGGIAIAKWNQSATATINITAGAAPIPTPPQAPIPVPTPTPSAPPSPTPAPTVAPTPPPPLPEAQGNIVASPVIAKRPEMMNPDKIDCDHQGNIDKNTAEFEFKFGKVNNASHYVVTLNASTAGNTYNQTLTVTDRRATFGLGRHSADYGEYILRVQPMNGDVAGDPVYLTFLHSAGLRANCYDHRRVGPSPLGAFTVNTVPDGDMLNLTWTGATSATTYVVSITANNSGYGAEFTTTSSGGTLNFPPRSQNGKPIRQAPYYRKYTLRIQPMNGTRAGDPVYKTVQYGPNDFTVW